jgi:hypothetical protein
VSQAGLAARPRSVLFGPDTSKEPPAPAQATLGVLHGLDRDDGMKILGRTFDEVLAYLKEGWTYRETFNTHGASILWFQDMKTPSPGPPGSCPRVP